MSALYDFLSSRHRRRQERRALSNPRYAELHALYGEGNNPHHYMSDNGERTVEKFFEYISLPSQLYGTPWWVRLHSWLQENGLRSQLRQHRWRRQRRRRLYSDYDLWSLDSYLSGLVSTSLAQFRDHPSNPGELELEPIINGFEKVRGSLFETSDLESQRAILDEFRASAAALKALLFELRLEDAATTTRGGLTRALSRGSQRAARGFSDADVPLLGEHIARVIARSVSGLRDIAHGYPDGMDFETWLRTLSEISLGYDAALRLMRGESADPVADRVTYERGADLFAEHFNALWD